MLRLVLMALLLILIGCSNDQNSITTTPDQYENRGKLFENTTIIDIEESYKIGDTIIYSFTSQQGRKYEIDITNINFDHVPRFICLNENSEQISSPYSPGYTHQCTIKVYIESVFTLEKERFDYHLQVEEMVRPESALLGDWLVVRRTNAGFNKSTTENYSRQNARKVIHIHEDTLYETAFVPYGNAPGTVSQRIDTEFFNPLGKFYLLDGDVVTFSRGNEHGYEEFELVRFTGAVSELIWFNDIQTAPEELIGIWYESSDYYRWWEKSDGIIEDERVYDDVYSNLNTPLILKITSDSVYQYKSQDNEYKLSTYSVSAYPDFLTSCTKESDNTLIDESIWSQFKSDGDFHINEEKTTYKKYELDLPSAE